MMVISIPVKQCFASVNFHQILHICNDDALSNKVCMLQFYLPGERMKKSVTCLQGNSRAIATKPSFLLVEMNGLCQLTS